ncbi:helix-turn-helix domain-containing protein [Streptomyces sp. NPDC058525]|uniref:helix-turn-helix domain-containing protein n=1 Tax=Streptomyces sp. NPDC058525 TaxID=3346538 RepID=UPI0036530E61
MCELLNRIWSRPRGEWTRVLRRELPALAAEIVEELLHGIPEFSALVDDNDAIDDELLRQRVEEALLTALGYRDTRGCPSGKEQDQQQHRHQERDQERDQDEDRHRDPHEDRDQDRQHPRRTPALPRAVDPAHRHAALEVVAGRDHDRHRAGDDDGDGPRHHDGDRARPHDGDDIRDQARHHDRQHGTHDGAQGDGHRTRPPLGPGADRARQDLFAALTDDRTPSGPSLAELADAAGWPLPVAVRAIAPAAPGEAQQLATVLDDALAGTFAGRPCLLVPSPDPDTRAPLELPLRGRFAAVGHAVPLRDTASSLRWALRLLALTPARAGLDARPVFVDDHLSTLLLLQDEPLAHALAARWLRPLADLTPRQSERLEVTLLAWLEGGGAPEAAKALSVHPQTVRYRMRQLEKLFGPGLRDPRTRFELEMALRSRRLIAQVRRQHSRVGRRTARVVTADFTPLVVGRMARVNGL